MSSLMMLIYVTILIILMIFSKQARGRPTWSLRATNVVLAGDLVPAGTVLVTPAVGT